MIEMGTDERSFGLAVNLWGSFAILVGRCVYGIIFLRPNIIVGVDLHQLYHEERAISQRTRLHWAGFDKQSFCHFSALSADETGSTARKRRGGEDGSPMSEAETALYRL